MRTERIDSNGTGGSPLPTKTPADTVTNCPTLAQTGSNNGSRLQYCMIFQEPGAFGAIGCNVAGAQQVGECCPIYLNDRTSSQSATQHKQQA